MRAVDADSPARYNADPRRLFGASGSAGKLILFAVRLDTFPAETQTRVFYIGTNDPGELTAIRRHMLTSLPALPIAGGTYTATPSISPTPAAGTPSWRYASWVRPLPGLFALKARIDSFCERVPCCRSTSATASCNSPAGCSPTICPGGCAEYRGPTRITLMIKVPGRIGDQTRQFLQAYFDDATGASFECTPEEGTAAFLLRFAAAGAAVRYRRACGPGGRHRRARYRTQAQ